MVQQVTGYSAFISSWGMANCPEDTIVVSRTVVAVHSDGVSTRENKELEGLDVNEVVETESTSSRGEGKDVGVGDEKGWKERPSLSTQSSFTQYVKEGSFLSLSPTESRSP